MNSKYIVEQIQKLFPMALFGLCLIVYNDISEMKKDIKMLLAQSNIDKTKIENLERALYNNRKVNFPVNNNERLLFKNEEFYDVKKYLPSIASS